MGRPLMLAVFAMGLLIGLGGVYALLKPAATTAPAAAPVDAAAILAQAEAKVQKPPLPAKPDDAREAPPKTVLLNIPLVHLGGQIRTIPHQVPQIAGTSQAAKNWQTDVDAKEAAYVQALQQEIDALTKAQAAAAADAARRGGASDWITSVLIPLIATVAGFLTALASLIGAMRPAAVGKTQ